VFFATECLNYEALVDILNFLIQVVCGRDSRALLGAVARRLRLGPRKGLRALFFCLLRLLLLSGMNMLYARLYRRLILNQDFVLREGEASFQGVFGVTAGGEILICPAGGSLWLLVEREGVDPVVVGARDRL
jgi:hypothetical protein